MTNDTSFPGYLDINGAKVHVAEVAEKVGHVSGVLHDKTAHLSAIHALPESVWPEAVEAMADELRRARG
jgi:hypothetical protein